MPSSLPAAWRDPWLWACLAAWIALVVHSVRAPLGEPVAEDFDFLYRALLTHHRSLLDGGGSSAFWRPIPHQLYYLLLGPVILAHPGVIAALHVTLLAAATVWIYLALRPALPRSVAAVAASFILLSESTRMLLSWPGLIVDLGLWVFVALAIHETAARRLPTALAALLAALLCKEVAVVAAVLLPWMPGVGPIERRDRVRWAVASLALLVAWACAYLWVRQHAHLVLPHQLETDARLASTPIITRLGWAFANSLKALFSLPAAPVRRAFVLAIAGVALIVAIVRQFASNERAKQRLAVVVPWIAWGTTWFVGATLTLLFIYPLWQPNRSGFGSLGFGIALAGLAWAARPWLLGALVGLRLVAFALSPGPATSVTVSAPETGAFMDFEQLTRLQLMMREVRSGLADQYPRLPSGSAVGYLFLPRRAEYAFGGDRAVRVWYRDTTLSWAGIDELERAPEVPLAAVVEYESNARPQWAWVNPEAMRHVLRAIVLQREGKHAEALPELDRAEDLEQGGTAAKFLSTLVALRSVTLLALGQSPAADYEANRAVALWHVQPDAHFVLATLRFEQGRLGDARAEIALALAANPGHAGALRLQRRMAGEAP